MTGLRSKPWLLGALGVVVVIAGLGLAAIGPAIIGVKPARDRTMLSGNALLVMDGPANIFLLPTRSGKVALVDCGTDPEAEAVMGALKARGLSADDVEAVFITHGHPDHIGGCGAFKRATLYSLAAEVGLIEGASKVASPFRSLTRPALKATGLTVTAPLNDGDAVGVGSLSVRAVAVPGHTPGSVAYLANRVLYLGDAATVTTAGALRNAVWVVSTDTRQAKRSLEAIQGKLAAAGASVETVAPAHSAPGPGTALRILAQQFR